MKSYIALAVLVAVISVAEGALDRNKSIELLKKCKEEAKATEDPVETYDKQIIPKTKEGKCMMACTLREKGLMKDGKVIQSAVVAFFEETYKDDSEKLEKAAESVGICSTTNVKGLDECETAAAYLECGQKNGMKL